jgi:hypothetical protein
VSKRKQIAALAAILILAVLIILLLALRGCGDRRSTGGEEEDRNTGPLPQGKTEQPTPAKAAPPQVGDAIPQPPPKPVDFTVATMLVNGQRVAEVPRGTPICVECLFRSPAGDDRAPPPELVLALRDAAGQVVGAGITPVKLAATWRGKSQPRAMAWRVAPTLAVGEYTIEAAELAGVRIAEATLRVTGDEADASGSAAVERRFLRLAGENAAWLEAVNAQLKAQPDNMQLLAERAAALEAGGDAPAALAAYRDMAARYQKQSGGQGDHPVPDWLVFKIEELTAAKP